MKARRTASRKPQPASSRAASRRRTAPASTARHRGRSSSGAGSRASRGPIRPPALVLAGDIGGTKTNIALFEPRGGKPVLVDAERFASHEHSGLLPILKSFLAKRRARIVAAGFGIAGPVLNGRSETTNLPWIVESSAIARALRAPSTLVNDLEATAHALPVLGPKSLQTLNPGRANPQGNLALIAAGTGLGEAFAVRTAAGLVVAASEGGHSDFAPRSAGEIELLRFLMERFGHVSVERILSGAGLVNVYEAIGALGWTEDNAHVAERMLREDKAAVVSSAALDGSSARAAEALRQFVSIYGAEAGNLALKVLATGGVYVGGGIAPKILPALDDGRFVAAFVDKGRFRDLLSSIPVKVILDDRAALIGAARLASLRAA